MLDKNQLRFPAGCREPMEARATRIGAWRCICYRSRTCSSRGFCSGAGVVNPTDPALRRICCCAATRSRDGRRFERGGAARVFVSLSYAAASAPSTGQLRPHRVQVHSRVVTVPFKVVSSLTVPIPPQCGYGKRCVVLSDIWGRQGRVYQSHALFRSLVSAPVSWIDVLRHQRLASPGA
jgi:hypothetical protein